MKPYLRHIAEKIKAATSTLSDAVVVVPSSRCIDELNRYLMDSDVILAPKYYTHEEFVLRFSNAHNGMYIPSKIEKDFVLAQVLESQGIDLSLLPTYASQIDAVSNANFDQIRVEYNNAMQKKRMLAGESITLKNVLDAAGQLSQKVFVIPKLDSDSASITLPANVLLFAKPEYYEHASLSLLNQHAKNFALKHSSISAIVAPLSRIKIALAENNVEQSHVIKAIIQSAQNKKVVIVNDNSSITALLMHSVKESGAKYKEYKSIADSHAYSLLQTIISFDGSEESLISLLTNPASKACATGAKASLLKPYGQLSKISNEGILELLESIMPDATAILVRLHELRSAQNFYEALGILQNIFLSFVNFKSCDPMVQFEFNEGFKDILHHAHHKQLPYNDSFNVLVQYFFSARSYEIRTGNDVEIVRLEQTDHMDLSDKLLILVDSGVAKLEKEALQDVDTESFNMLAYRIIRLIHNDVIIVKNENPADESSIMYDSIMHEMSPEITDEYSKLRFESYPKVNAAYPQPAVSVSQSARPTEYSVSDIEQIMNDPYVFYLKRILKLKESEKVWEFNHAKEFGNLLHAVISKVDWLKLHSALDEALEEFDNEALRFGIESPIYDAWKERVIAAIEFLVAYYEENPVTRYASEKDGYIELDVDDNKIKIKARADRIDIYAGGDVSVVDFKSGATPTQKDVKEGRKPQLAVESLILQKGGFGIDCANPDAVYISLSNKSEDQKDSRIKVDIPAVEESLHNVMRLFYASSAPYFATPVESSFGYKHLKRLSEWL